MSDVKGHHLTGSNFYMMYWKWLKYNDRCEYLNSNPVFIAKHFQFRAQVFFKQILFDWPLGKTKYWVYTVEF